MGVTGGFSGGWSCPPSALFACFRFLAITTKNAMPINIARPPIPAPTPMPAFAPVLSEFPASVCLGGSTIAEDEAAGSDTVVAGDVDVEVLDSGASEIRVVGAAHFLPFGQQPSSSQYLPATQYPLLQQDAVFGMHPVPHTTSS